MIHLEPAHRKIIDSILQKYPYTFYAFGSRVKGTHRQLSDLDICFMENIPLNIVSHIKEDFDESNLPFTVDIVDWQKCDENFRAIIRKNLELLSKN